MTRQCMRPGCDRLASACLTYNADSSAVWLQDPGEIDEPAQLVCSLHAESLTVPLGWSVTDRRTLAAAKPIPGHSMAHNDSDISDPDHQPEPGPESELEPEPEPVPASEPEPEPEPESESESEPTESEAGEAEPTDPQPSVQRRKAKKNKLLDRAFEWTGPQHSVLTTKAPTSENLDPADDVGRDD